jgi:hypothetical protein
MNTSIFAPAYIPEVQIIATFLSRSKKAVFLTLTACEIIFDVTYHVITSRLFKAIVELAWMFLVWIALVLKEQISSLLPGETVQEIIVEDVITVTAETVEFDPDPIGTELQSMTFDPIIAPEGNTVLDVAIWTKAQCKNFLDSKEITYGKKDRVDELRAKVLTNWHI